MARLAVVGAGYVGVCTAAALGEMGHDVTLVDIDASKLRAIDAGRAPFFEPGVDDALRDLRAAERLRTAPSVAEGIAQADIIFLAVGTPNAPDGSHDLRFLRAAAHDIGVALRDMQHAPVVVTKSTVPPGTTRDVVAPAIAAASGKTLGRGFHVASNPEFLREGAAMHDARHPDRIVIGAEDEETASRVRALFAGHSCPILVVDTATAEFIKLAANAFLAAKVGLSNELANVAARQGVDWYRVAEGIGLDPRIGPLFLRAGAGFGGSCFPKDVAAIAHLARTSQTPSLQLEATLRANDLQPLVTVAMLREEAGSLEGKRIALLGLAFKPETDDVRETRALPIYEALVKEGASVVVHDPKASANFARLAPGCETAASAENALRGADGCIVQTEWVEYGALAPSRFLALMRAPIVVDGRRTFDPAAMRAAGVRYRAIGLGS